MNIYLQYFSKGNHVLLILRIKPSYNNIQGIKISGCAMCHEKIRT